MNNRLMFRPNLVDCILEERVAPRSRTWPSIILTTNGLTLIEAFPGANNSGAGSLGRSSSGGGSATSVSGAAIPTSLYITGTGGISSLKPGNITGVPSLAAGASDRPAASPCRSRSVRARTRRADPTNNVSNGGATNNVVGLATVADPTARARR